MVIAVVSVAHQLASRQFTFAAIATSSATVATVIPARILSAENADLMR
jgi:hypothetical protein